MAQTSVFKFQPKTQKTEKKYKIISERFNDTFQDANPVSWMIVLYLTHSVMMACFWCIFCHSFLRSNNCPRGTLTMMWQCDWSLFQEQHQHCNIRCTHNSSHRLLCLSVRHTDLLHSLHNVFHSLPLSLFFSISQALSTIFFFWQ